MTKPIVLIDMDDTMCHLTKPIVNKHNELFIDNAIDYGEVHNFALEGCLHPEFDVERFLKTPGLYENLELLDDYVIDEIKRIDEDYDVVIVTASFSHSVVEKWKWVQKHLPFIPYENFIVAARKDLVGGDILIDDAKHNLIPFVESGRPAIAIQHEWNKDLIGQDNLTFTKGWKGMKDLIDFTLKYSNVRG